MSSSRDDFGIAIRSALLQRGARQKFSLFFLICLSILTLDSDDHLFSIFVKIFPTFPLPIFNPSNEVTGSIQKGVADINASSALYTS